MTERKLKYSNSRPVRIKRKIYPNYVKAAQELHIPSQKVYKRLVSENWPDWQILTVEECHRLYPHYKNTNIGKNYLTLLHRLKTSKPFWYKGKLYLSSTHASIDLDMDRASFSRILKRGAARYATREQAKEYILKGYFDDVPSLDNPPPRL